MTTLPPAYRFLHQNGKSLAFIISSDMIFHEMLHQKFFFFQAKTKNKYFYAVPLHKKQSLGGKMCIVSTHSQASYRNLLSLDQPGASRANYDIESSILESTNSPNKHVYKADTELNA